MRVGRLAPALLLAGCVAPTSPPPPPGPQATVVRPAEAAPVAFALSGALRQGGLVLGTAPEGTTAVTLDGAAVPLGAARRFLVGFDRDAPGEARLRATLADGRIHEEVLRIAPGEWRLEELPIPRGTSPSPEYQRLRSAELARIAAARAVSSDTDGWQQRFLWPVTGRISGLFGAQRVYRGEKGSYHSGTDVARPEGTPVVAAADGVVVLAAERPFSLEGNLLMIDHGMGLNSSYLHLSRIDVAVGDRVRRGQPVGAVGKTGRVTGPHLHWSLKWRDARVDPMLLAGPMPGQGATP